MSAKPRPSWSWRWACRCSRRFIRPGGRRGSILSKRCVTSDRAMDDTTTDTTIVEAPPSTRSEERPIVLLHEVSRRFRQGDSTLDILKSAELAVWPGQSVALIAPSGAGKSTLLHIAGLLEHADAGEVYIDSVATSNLTDMARTRIRRTEIDRK